MYYNDDRAPHPTLAPTEELAEECLTAMNQVRQWALTLKHKAARWQPRPMPEDFR
jgi:hypothetical protein